MGHKLITKLTIITILTILTNLAYAADKGNDPVAYWRFDEGGGPTAYDDMDAYDGTLQPGDNTGSNDTAGEMWTAGKLGNALECDGMNDYADHTDFAIAKTSSWSFSMWQYKATGSGTAWQGFIGKSIGTSGGYWMWHPDLMWYQDYYDPGGGYEYYGYLNSDLNLGDEAPYDEWFHLAVTYNGTNFETKVYINGVLRETKTATWSPRPVSQFTFSQVGMGGGSRYFEGNIDDVKVYDYVRTPAQVFVDYNAGMAAKFGVRSSEFGGNAPVAYWSMGNVSGSNLYDESGSGYNGTITNATQAQGRDGMALSFDGDGDYVDCGNPSALDFPTSDFTISLWMKSDTTPYYSSDPDYYATASAILDKGTGSAVDGYGVWFTKDNTINFATDREGAGRSDLKSATKLSLGKWHHVAVQRKSDVKYIFIDGVQDSNTASVSGQEWSDTTRSLFIGKHDADGTVARPNGWPQYFDGLIDEVKIYNYARTQAQIAYDYNKGRPIAHYKFDEGTGTIAHNAESSADAGSAPVGWWRMDNDWTDSSGGGYTGIATGATFSSSTKIGPYAGNFDGGDYVGISVSPISNTDDLTIELWVNADAATHIWSTFLASQSFRFSISAVNQIALSWTDGTSSAHVYSGTDFSLGVWHHVAVVKSGTDYTFYIDGVQSGTVSSTAYSRTITSLEIGRDTLSGIGSADYITGLLDDFRIYDYARTAEQIYNDYKSTHGTMVADTKFVDGKLGKALEFDGTGDYMTIPNSIPSDDTHTICFWVKPAASGDVWIDMSGDSGYSFIQINSDMLYVGYSPTSAAYRSYTYAFTLDDWYHIAVVKTAAGDNMNAYVNGKLLTSYTGSVGDMNSGDLMYLGKFHAGSGWDCIGVLDDVRIYNYARTAAQVMVDYNAGTAFHPGGGTGEKDPWDGDLPVGHWKFDENTGILGRDASENGNDGTLGGDGAGTDVPTWTNGKHGPGLSFDGSDDYVASGSTMSVATGTSASIAAWVKTTDSSLQYEGIACISIDSNALQIIALNSYARAWFINQAVTGDIAINDGNWHHVVVTKAPSTVKLYVDGVLDETLSVTDGPVESKNVYIGRSQWVDEYWPGSIDDVRIYDYALTQAQVSWLYNKGKPLIHYRFDEEVAGQAVDTSAGAIKDDSGNYNGTATNTTWENYATGKFGSSMSFDGNDWVDPSYVITLDDGEQYTFSAWVKFDTTASTIAIAGNNIDWFLIHRDTASSSRFEARIWDGSTDPVDVRTVTADNYTDTTKWYHVAYVVDRVNDVLQLYVDGVLKDTETIPEGYGSPDLSLGIGGNVNTWDWDGKIDDVRIYNYARTAEQVMLDYNQGMAAKLGD